MSYVEDALTKEINARHEHMDLLKQDINSHQAFVNAALDAWEEDLQAVRECLDALSAERDHLERIAA